jgi:CRISPR/Cas system-associated endoribonuclease Cas2
MKMNERFLLIFDIPEEKTSLKRRINRALHKSNAEFVQQSVWRSKDLESLRKVAEKIRSEGARASILKEEIVF